VRIGRRVRVRRTDVERLCATVEVAPEPPPVGLDEARETLDEALERAQRLRRRRSAARRAELAEGLQERAGRTEARSLFRVNRSRHCAQSASNDPR
jgi:hypothetical protein